MDSRALCPLRGQHCQDCLLMLEFAGQSQPITATRLERIGFAVKSHFLGPHGRTLQDGIHRFSAEILYVAEEQRGSANTRLGGIKPHPWTAYGTLHALCPPSSIAWSFLCCKLCVMSTINASIYAHVCIFSFSTSGTQNPSAAASCFFAFSLPPLFPSASLSLSSSIFTLSVYPPSFLCLPLSLSSYPSLSLCVSPLRPVSVSPCDFLVYQPDLLYFSHYSSVPACL